jgi:hypothetical protein
MNETFLVIAAHPPPFPLIVVSPMNGNYYFVPSSMHGATTTLYAFMPGKKNTNAAAAVC